MAVANRLKQLRQERGWSQEQLARKANIHQKQISSYERGKTLPSTEILIRFAETFDVSLDYLAFDKEGKNAPIDVSDRELIRRFEEVDKLDEKDRKIIIEVMDVFILKNKFKGLTSA